MLIVREVVVAHDEAPRGGPSRRAPTLAALAVALLLAALCLLAPRPVPPVVEPPPPVVEVPPPAPPPAPPPPPAIPVEPPPPAPPPRPVARQAPPAAPSVPQPRWTTDKDGYRIYRVECAVRASFPLPEHGVVVFETTQPDNDPKSVYLHDEDVEVTPYGFAFSGTYDDDWAVVQIPGQGRREFQWKNGVCTADLGEPATVVTGRVEGMSPDRSVWIQGCGVILAYYAGETVRTRDGIRLDGSFQAELTAHKPCSLAVYLGDGVAVSSVDIAPEPGARIDGVVLSTMADDATP